MNSKTHTISPPWVFMEDQEPPQKGVFVTDGIRVWIDVYVGNGRWQGMKTVFYEYVAWAPIVEPTIQTWEEAGYSWKFSKHENILNILRHGERAGRLYCEPEWHVLVMLSMGDMAYAKTVCDDLNSRNVKWESPV